MMGSLMWLLVPSGPVVGCLSNMGNIMPHLRFRGIAREPLARLSGQLVQDLSTLTGAPVAHFTLELVASEFIIAGQTVPGYPFVELMWFDRGQVVQDQAAQLITQAVKAQLGAEQDVAVIVLPLTRTAYYDNGQHYG